MSNLVEVPPPPSDVKETLESVLERHETLHGVLILGIKKSGSTTIDSSTLSAYEKVFLAKFLDAYLTDWFGFEKE